MLSQQLKAIQLEQQWSNIKYQIKLFCCKDFSSKLNNILPAAQSITVSFRCSTIHFRNSLNIQDSLWQIYFPSIYFNYQFLSCLAHLWLPSAYQVERENKAGRKGEQHFEMTINTRIHYRRFIINHCVWMRHVRRVPFCLGVYVCGKGDVTHSSLADKHCERRQLGGTRCGAYGSDANEVKRRQRSLCISFACHKNYLPREKRNY